MSNSKKNPDCNQEKATVLEEHQSTVNKTEDYVLRAAKVQLYIVDQLYKGSTRKILHSCSFVDFLLRVWSTADSLDSKDLIFNLRVAWE